MQHEDSEIRQLRALELMEALEFMFENIGDHEDVPARYVAALIHAGHRTIRDALPRSAAMLGANDTDD